MFELTNMRSIPGVFRGNIVINAPNIDSEMGNLVTKPSIEVNDRKIKELNTFIPTLRGNTVTGIKNHQLSYLQIKILYLHLELKAVPRNIKYRRSKYR